MVGHGDWLVEGEGFEEKGSQWWFPMFLSMDKWLSHWHEEQKVFGKVEIIWDTS